MHTPPRIAIVGAGPAGLIAAEHAACAGCHVQLFDHMPNPARKLLMAGRGGLNLTHSEPLEDFLPRYGEAATWLAPCISAFPPRALIDWCEGLGEPTFVGSSGRIFPARMKASGLLRAWLKRLDGWGVTLHTRHRWQGWQGNALVFDTPHGPRQVIADATLLALGGASWPKLGSDAHWAHTLQQAGVQLAPFLPANSGFVVNWSTHLKTRFAGTPLKPVSISHAGTTRQGEAMITTHGIEGGVIYALARTLREQVLREGKAELWLDVRPDMSHEALTKKLGRRGSKSLGAWLRSAGLSPLVVALLHETTPQTEASAAWVAARLKALPLQLVGVAGLERAISSSGGVMQSEVTDDFMLRKKPGVFVAGEMLDWEAPTGGYLLQACFSTGVAAATGMLNWVKR